MQTLLYIKASPRGRESKSAAVAEAYLGALCQRLPELDVDVLDLSVSAPDSGVFDVPPELAQPYDPVAARVGDEHPELFDRGSSFAFLQGEPVNEVVATEIAPQIYHLTGGTHHSLAIGTDHGVVVVEAPNDDDRSLAVQAAVARLFPGKAIRYVINTHHHHDHVGGLRTYVARGVPVVAPATDLGFLSSVVAAPHMLRPDTLARAPRAAQLIGVDAAGWSYTDGRTIQAILLSSAHVEQQLVIYVPDAKLVFEADLYFPTFFPLDQPTPGPFGETTRALYQELVLDRGLDLDVIAGGHAGVANGTVFRVNAGF